jgi:hypothetical protein
VVLGLVEDGRSILTSDPLLAKDQTFVDAFSYLTPVMDMPVFLAYLAQQVVAKGGRIVRKRLTRLSEAYAFGTLVINCTGLAARWLCNDAAVYAVQGLFLCSTAATKSLTNELGAQVIRCLPSAVLWTRCMWTKTTRWASPT